jgi:Fur family transcriptional regulator, stress-responsive regulator
MSDDPGDRLREHGLRVTPQRRAILQAFRAADDEHLAADEVMARASAAVPEIGRGTVYATLAELTELGLLLSVGHAEPVRYELNTGPHDHFRCRLCLRLLDIDFGGGELIHRPLPGYQVESVTLRAEGICKHCLDYRHGLSDGAAMIGTAPLLSPDELDGLACRRYPSPLGPLGLAASAVGIARIAFEDHADFEAIERRARTRRGPAAGRDRLSRLTEALDNYFGGGGPQPNDAADFGNREQLAPAALEATRDIPYGHPRSYHQLGIAIPAYHCGYAMGSNPIPLACPCHRVSCGSERPETYVGGTSRLRILQQLEAANQPS